MRPVKTRPRFKCDHCRYTSSSIPGMTFHEGICFQNPNRICPTCNNEGYVDEYAPNTGYSYKYPCPFCKKEETYGTANA